MKKIIFIGFVLFSSISSADVYGPYNQQYSFNQQYGSTNWYSSPLGMGVAQAGVLLMGGIVNAMSRPNVEYVQVPQQQYQQPQYQQYQQPQYPYYGYGPR